MTTPKFKKKKVSKASKMKSMAKKCSDQVRKNIGTKLLNHVLLNIDRATMTPESISSQRYYRIHLDGSDVGIVMEENPTVINRVLTVQFGAYHVHHDLGFRLPIVDKEGKPIVEYVGDPAQLKPLSKAEQWIALCNSPLLQPDGYKLTGTIYGDMIDDT